MIASIIIIILACRTVENAVLDPALYLAPSPPLKLTSDNIRPEEMWARSVEAETERNLYINSPENIEITTIEITPKPEAAVGRMFWPRFSQPQPALGIHIPLSFSLSGSYGKVPSQVSGAVANTYSSVANLGAIGKTAVVSGFGRSALAGSSYGNYGTGAVRVYGGDNTAAWSGWGNGKWGHYGKG